MFQFIKRAFFLGLTISSGFTNANSLNAIPLSCISMSNQKCKTRPQVINVNGDEPVFFPFSIKTSKCSGSCNNIIYPYVIICVPDIVKNLNVKVFNLMSRTNGTRFIDGMKLVDVSVNFEKMFAVINNIGIKINVDVNAKN